MISKCNIFSDFCRRRFIDVKLFDPTILSLVQSLNYASTKNRVIANNIANVDTPRFKAKEVRFKNVLADELEKNMVAKKTNEKHVDFSDTLHKPYVIRMKNNTTYNHNGNNVDIDKEMSELAKNQIYYQGLVDRINGKFGKIQTVLRGGS